MPEESSGWSALSGAQLADGEGDILWRTPPRRRRAAAVAGRTQTARRRPESHLLSTSCLRAPTATHLRRRVPPPAADVPQLAARRHGEPERQLKYRGVVPSELVH